VSDQRPIARIPVWRQIVLALAAPLAALAATLPLRAPLQRTSMLIFWAAVFVAARYGGFVAGTVAAAFSVLLAALFVFEPLGSLGLAAPGVALSLVGFLALALGVSLLVERLRRTQRVAVEHARELEHSSARLREQAGELERNAAALERRVAESRALMEALRESEARLRQVADAEREARERAEEASRAKSQFLALMSHELRTPLNAIGGYAELMEMELNGPLTAEQRTILGRLRRSHAQLARLVAHVLDLAALGAGELALTVEDVDVAAALDEVAARRAPEAAAHGVALDVPGGTPGLRARADRARMREIVDSLLGNAIKFTAPGGRIELRWGAVGGMACIEVRDSGIGIPDSEWETIFEPFTQMDRGLTRTVDGAGLGLPTSRALARAMGGEVSVASRPGEGSVFRVLLPAAGSPS
jgi:signal transduction histidine kinase